MSKKIVSIMFLFIFLIGMIGCSNSKKYTPSRNGGQRVNSGGGMGR